ncbi:MAG: hypothetical protein HZB38_01365, partial [Planctomycetes bacterium]|nr:hypothetical protein [Planctomycetota bacterium]
MKKTLATLAATASAAVAFGQSVSLSLSSPQNGQTVSPGSTVNWTISFSVSAGNNQGLALLVTDLAQDGANPSFFDIPIAGSVPGGMSNFARPAGITNPGDGSPVLGYRGVQRGTAGQKNLLQVGGAQNTFGQARPAGSGVGENANVVAGVGQSGTTTLATGSFTAPSTAGTYTFSLANATANVLTQVNAPPNYSPVAAAAMNVAAPSISFTVSASQPCVGDINNDHQVDLSDLTLLLSQFGSTGS